MEVTKLERLLLELDQIAKDCPKCGSKRLTTLNNQHPLQHRCLDCQEELIENSGKVVCITSLKKN